MRVSFLTSSHHDPTGKAFNHNRIGINRLCGHLPHRSFSGCCHCSLLVKSCCEHVKISIPIMTSTLLDSLFSI